MKVKKQFYIHKDKKTYNVGDTYKGEKFKDWESYLEAPKTKQSKK